MLSKRLVFIDSLFTAIRDGTPYTDRTGGLQKNVAFLADKLPLEQRFAASFQKCITEDAVEAHSRRYQAAVRLKNTINSLCGKEIIL